MGVPLLILVYLGTAALVTGIAVWVLGGLRRRRPSAGAVVVLHLLPLVFTAAGFLPGRTLAPNGLLAGVPPWCHPDLVARFPADEAPPNPLLVDALSQMQPWRHAARSSLLLDPATHGGAALLGNAQSAVLFPVEVIARWLPPPRAATYVQAARLLLAVWGMFLLLRGLALTEGAALAGSAVWVGCGFLQLWRLHPHSYVAALAPWILLAMLRLARRPGPHAAAGLAVAGALGVFGGHPETLLHILVLGVLLVLLLGRRPAGSGGWLRFVGWSAVAVVLSCLLAAPVLLPVLQTLPRSFEWQQRMADPAPVELEVPLPEAATRLAPSLDPFALGDPRDGTWRGPENLMELAGGAVALAALALIPVALGLGRNRHRYRRLAWAWLLPGLLGLLVAAHVPLVSRPLEWLPLLRDSLVKRWGLWWVLAVSILTAVAWWRLRRGQGRWAALGASVGLALLLAVVRNAFSMDRAAGEVLLAPAVLVLLVLAVWLLRVAPRIAAALLFALLLLPQGLLFGRWVPVVSAESFYPSTPAVAFVQAGLAARPVTDQGYRVAGLDAALTPHAATFFGLEDVRGYDPMVFAPYVEFLRPLAPPQRDTWTRFDAWDHPILDFLGVRYLFDHPTAYPFHHPGVEQVYAGEDALVYENPDALPRVFVPRWVSVTNEVQALEDPLQVTARGPGLPGAGRYENRGMTLTHLEVGRGEILARVDIPPGLTTAEATAGSVAVVATSQPAIPGWRVWIEGREVEPLRIQGAFLGVALDPMAVGSHRLELRYQPRAWRWGLASGSLGLLMVIFLRFFRPTQTGGFPREGRQGNIAASSCD